MKGQSFAALVLLSLLMAFAVHAETTVVRSGPPPSSFGGCAVATEQGALQDADCDRQPNQYDNCPLTLNPDQLDRDHNGIGDACDLLIEQTSVEPETPIQGRSMVIYVTLLNNRAYAMRNLVVKAEAPKLGVATSEDVPLINPGERIRKELIVRVPDCAEPTFTDIAVFADYPVAPGQKEVFSQAVKVPIAPSGLCAGGVGDDKTVVDILEIQDVDPIKGALYPFKITNLQQESVSYILSVQGTDEWGAAAIAPGSVIVIPPGATREGTLQVWARPEASGKKSFGFTVQSRDDLKQVTLTATIPEQKADQSVSASSKTRLLLGVLGFAAVVLIIFSLYRLVK